MRAQNRTMGHTVTEEHMEEHMDSQIVDEIVAKAAGAVYQRLEQERGGDVAVVKHEEKPEETPQEYGFALSRPLWFEKKYRIVGHTFDPNSGHLFIGFKDGNRLAIPNIAKKAYRVYPLI